MPFIPFPPTLPSQQTNSSVQWDICVIFLQIKPWDRFSANNEANVYLWSMLNRWSFSSWAIFENSNCSSMKDSLEIYLQPHKWNFSSFIELLNVSLAENEIQRAERNLARNKKNVIYFNRISLNVFTLSLPPYLPKLS